MPQNIEKMRTNHKKHIRTSKFLSLILRHNPGVIGITLSPEGWADVDELLEKAQACGRHISREMLAEVVRENDKQRFAFDETGANIRASQGHSIAVDLRLPPAVPPDVLFHGTATRFLERILSEGLKRMSRQHVHLSKDRATASKVGVRHGTLAILKVDARKMHQNGHVFYLSENGVWLINAVPPKYLTRMD